MCSAVIVLNANGPVFCAGNDLKERGAKVPSRNYQAKIISLNEARTKQGYKAVAGGDDIQALIALGQEKCKTRAVLAAVRVSHPPDLPHSSVIGRPPSATMFSGRPWE